MSLPTISRPWRCIENSDSSSRAHFAPTHFAMADTSIRTRWRDCIRHSRLRRRNDARSEARDLDPRRQSRTEFIEGMSMMRVGFVGWRGMVGSVLLQRMLEENDFERIDPVFFSTSSVGGSGPLI